jgi:hypothetical protein
MGTMLPGPPGRPSEPVRSVPIKDVIPVRTSERCSCSYCGQIKWVAYRIVPDEGGEAVVCYPCSDRGMQWLEQNFPRPV